MFNYLNNQLLAILETNTPLYESPIANRYGGSWLVKSGTKIGSFLLKDSCNNDLVMSGQVNEYLQEVSTLGGSGMVCAIMDSHPNGNPNNPRDHRSGNKLDLGLGSIAWDEQAIIQKCIPFIKHPATVHLSFEGLGHNNEECKQLARKIVSKIKSEHTELKDRLSDIRLETEWGWTAKRFAPHIDILINPEKLFNVPKPLHLMEC